MICSTTLVTPAAAVETLEQFCKQNPGTEIGEGKKEHKLADYK